MEKKTAFAMGWLLGACVALFESIPFLSQTAHSRSLVGATFLVLACYPLLGGVLGLVLGAIPPFRTQARLHALLLLVIVFPWLLGRIFPLLTPALLLRPANATKAGAVLILTILLIRESTRWLRQWLRFAPRRTWILLLPAILGILGFFLVLPSRTAISPQSPSPPQSSMPNVLLISIDTLRGDELGPYGGIKGNSPCIDSLAASGAIFTNCTSCAPWTLASVSSFMSGLYPSTTGVFTGENRLSEDVYTISELFQDHGYHTRAIIANIWLRSQFGLDQGFDVYDHRWQEAKKDPRLVFFGYRLLHRWVRQKEKIRPESAVDIANRAVDFLSHSPARPFFLWLHFNDLHDPYEPPREYAPPRPRQPIAFPTSSGRIINLRMGRRVTASQQERIRALYRGELRYVDAEISRVLRVLRSAGLAHTTVVALTSDHGEEFWEHGSVGHGHTLYHELTNVPLILSWPGKLPEGEIRHEPISLVDLAPTVADLIGLELPSELPGRSVLANGDQEEFPQFAEALEFFGELKSISYGGWKLIQDPESGDARLYDLGVDPHEKKNSAWHERKRVEQLQEMLAAHLLRCRALGDSLQVHRETARMHLTPALREMLRAQGYIE